MRWNMDAPICIHIQKTEISYDEGMWNDVEIIDEPIVDESDVFYESPPEDEEATLEHPIYLEDLGIEEE